VLALGGYLQATACLAVRDLAIPSQHVGDLDTCGARSFLEEVALQLEQLFDAPGQIIAVDRHPDYPSTWLGERLAEERGVPIMRVQHHLAHAVAVLSEHDALPAAPGERACALVLDGTGYGEDGTTWGCEWLSISEDLSWSRLASGEALTLVGGERAVREPWRVALAAFARAGELPLLHALRPRWKDRAADLERLLCSGDWPRARGAGRLFEAAGALFGLCSVNSWEGEAAARFEALACASPHGAERWSEVALPPTGAELPSTHLLVAAARRLRAGADAAATALGFHRTFSALAAELSLRAFGKAASSVAIGGGCLVNRHLRHALAAEHDRLGMHVILPRAIPAGDGGLSYGQASLAAWAQARQKTPIYRGGL